MNKLTTLLALLLLLAPVGVFAQEASTQSPNTEYPLLQNKLEKSDKAIVHDKKKLKAKTWSSRAEIFMDIYDVNRKYIENMPMLSIKFAFGTEKEIRTETKEGKKYETYVYDRVNITYEDGKLYNYEETQKIDDDPLPKALAALEKAEELNAADHKLDKKLSEDYTRLSNLFEHKGGREYFYAKDVKAAVEDFKNSIAIDSKELVGPVVDTTLMYHTGLLSVDVEEYESSNEYLQKALDYNYPKPGIYALMKRNYFALGDTAQGIEVLKEGFSKYPDSQDIVVEFINYFLLTGKSKEALEYIKMAQEKDPANISLIFAEAHMYDKQGEAEKAADTYKKVIDIDPSYFDAYFNLGVVYYYYGQDFFKKASGSDVSNEEYDALMKQGNDQLRNAIEPMEQCIELLEAKESLSEDEAKTLKSVYETLRSIYYRFEMTEKYNAVDAKLKAIE